MLTNQTIENELIEPKETDLKRITLNFANNKEVRKLIKGLSIDAKYQSMVYFFSKYSVEIEYFLEKERKNRSPVENLVSAIKKRFLSRLNDKFKKMDLGLNQERPVFTGVIKFQDLRTNVYFDENYIKKAGSIIQKGEVYGIVLETDRYEHFKFWYKNNFRNSFWSRSLHQWFYAVFVFHFLMIFFFLDSFITLHKDGFPSIFSSKFVFILFTGISLVLNPEFCYQNNYTNLTKYKSNK